MRTIEVDDDVYGHILRNAESIGEPASSILRRLFGTVPPNNKALPLNGRVVAVANDPDLELLKYVRSVRYLAHRTATKRYLGVLAFGHKQKPGSFDKVLTIPSGRTRVYFAKSEQEIKRSGTNTSPRQIPGSSYWAMTNSDTPQKREDLSTVLRLLGYGPAAITEAIDTIV